MLKRRIIATLLFRDGVLVRTKRFEPDYIYTKNQVNTEHCDEICAIRVGGSWDSFFSAVSAVTDHAMLPLTIGGGLSSMDEVGRCFRQTVCDKVVIEEHLAALAGPVCAKWGRQSLVAGVTEGRGESHTLPSVGEIFVQSVERDGSLRGYPLEFGKQFLSAGVPVIIGSGCEGYRSMLQGFEAGFDACATSNIHHFTPTGMRGIKSQLTARGVELRA